jgi:Transglutaminase-like superfamily
MRFLALRAYLMLIRFDHLMAKGNFAAVHERIRIYPVQVKAVAPETVARICTAVDLACIWYRKEVLCLLRSAVTTCLLRNNGMAARLVIGTQQLPFKSHAWVEICGRVVNDKTYMPEIYDVLDRC